MLFAGACFVALAARGPMAAVLGLIIIGGAAAISHRWMIRDGGVPVLVYHSVSENSDWLRWAPNISVSPAIFVRHLEILQSLGCTIVRTSVLVEARWHGRPLPPRAVVLNFDDGYLDNWIAVFPIVKRFDVPATIYVSLDFIEAGATPRLTIDDVAAGSCRREDLVWEGYLNWAELRVMERSRLIDVESHGVDHGRVPVGPGVIDILNAENWQRFAWLQWQAMPGNKTGWFRHAEPPFVSCGTAVPVSASALVARAWRDGCRESIEDYEARVSGELCRSREELGQGLEKTISILCWPFDASTPASNRLAFAAGFDAVTGGQGENRKGQDPAVISRLHVVERALGWRWAAADELAFRANVRLFQGNYYWGFLVLAINLIRNLVVRCRRGRMAVAP